MVQTFPSLKECRHHQVTWMSTWMISHRASSQRNGVTWACSQCTDGMHLLERRYASVMDSTHDHVGRLQIVH